MAERTLPAAVVDIDRCGRCRIGPGGANLDPAGLAIAATPRTEHDAVLAAGSSKSLVAYARDAIAPRYDGRDRVFLRLVEQRMPENAGELP